MDDDNVVIGISRIDTNPETINGKQKNHLIA